MQTPQLPHIPKFEVLPNSYNENIHNIITEMKGLKELGIYHNDALMEKILLPSNNTKNDNYDKITQD